MAFYRDRQMEKVRQHARKAARFYFERAAVCDRPFWRERGDFGGDAPQPPFVTDDLDATCRLQLSKLTAIEGTAVIQGDTVVPMLAVRHETLERPVAFLEDVSIVPLLNQIRSGQTAESIVSTWSERLPVDTSWKIMGWLWQRRIVVPHSTDQEPLVPVPLGVR